MELTLKCILLCGLFVSALGVVCDRDSECTAPGVIRCAAGQMPRCSKGQCYCRTGAWCVMDRNCRDNCGAGQTYHCNYVRCYCGGLSKGVTL